MLLERAHEELGWPEPDAVRSPPGAGHSITSSLADRKLGGALRRRETGLGVTVGILAADPSSTATEAPLAIVCEFNRAVKPETLEESHRLAWNFCRAPLLITIEPHVLRAWTCCEPPGGLDDLFSPRSEIREVQTDLDSSKSLGEQAARSLRWIELATGSFFQQHAGRFRRDRCADRLLLENLRAVRRILTTEQKLDPDICHDLLARLIFIQFLFDRKDSLGQPALSARKLADLHRAGTLSQPYASLGEVLEHYEDAYALFRWLNSKFNGDLFPGTGASEQERDAEWIGEKHKVRPEHLQTLAGFVSGSIELGTGQALLWREYSFDVIPLEFISSIYEEFVTEPARSQAGEKGSAGVVYTPPHLVDFLLDAVLPWHDPDWDLKILDPACGSGIFLVKAYQRLIHRWRLAHDTEPKAADLKRLLENNLFGVDVNPHAVRVASFSLYLAMCDEIDPRHYWTQVKFPTLRGRRLMAKDFFNEEIAGIRSEEDSETYDRVIGNAPWGSETIGDADVGSWISRGWSPTYGSIGPLFLPKAAALCKASGIVSMLQPAGLIIHDVGPAERFSRKLLETFAIVEIVNLAALRFQLFPKAVSPACIITFRPIEPTHEPFLYICPKETRTLDDDYRIVVEPQDIGWIHPDEVAGEKSIWTALMWGGPRDLALLRRLNGNENLATLKKRGLVISRQGINPGDRKRTDSEILGRKILKSRDFPPGTFRDLQASVLTDTDDDDCLVDAKSSRDYSAFSLPQIILKQGWQKNRSQFAAAVVRPDPAGDGKGILCSKSYISIHADPEHRKLLDAIWLTFNSRFAVYYLFRTSSRFATYRPEVSVKDLLNVPVVKPSNGNLDTVSDHEQIDHEVRKALGLKPSEWVLIEDLCKYTLPDFKGDASSPGRLKTRPEGRSSQQAPPEPVLKPYCELFVESLKSIFGEDKGICATIFQETGAALPIRLVAIHLEWPRSEEVRFEPVDPDVLGDRILALDRKPASSPEGQSVFNQRTARIYETVDIQGRRTPTIYLIKPDRCRYWTRSMALRDSDEVTADILAAGGRSDFRAAPRRPRP